MERLYEELDETKAENEKLQAGNKSKTELIDNLKRVQNEQLTKLREATSKLENQGVELDEKTAEISSLRQMLEDLKHCLSEKESILKRVSTANEKLKVEWQQKYRNCEEQNRSLMFALDEANEKIIDKEQNISVYRAEIEGLKALLSASKNKCVEAEKNAKALKELRERDSVLLGLEEENSSFKDQLKWKKEQFKHLEEAHEKLKSEFNASKREWERERSNLFDEISSLQTNLDSQTRISEDLQKKLEMCNHALSSEETRRKFLEFQVSEYKARYEDVFAEFQDAKSQLECLTVQRGEEIADLRHLLSTKETYYRELEYQKLKLEQENQELLASLKELQEAGIQGSGSSSSFSKLKNKLKNVEQIHRSCSTNLRAKEAEWSSQLETVTQELFHCRSELERKESTLQELEKELDSCNLSAIQMKLHYEELVVVSMVLKSTISEAQAIHINSQSQMNQIDKVGEEKLSLLMKQFELKNAALAKAQKDYEEERERATSLLSRVEYLESVEDQQFHMLKQMEVYKQMLEESSRCQMQYEEKALLVERKSGEKVREVCDALDMANSELAKERENVASLSKQVESFALVKERQLLMQKELERSKEMLEESSEREMRLEEQIAELESDSEIKIRQLSDALNSTKAELAKERDKVQCLEQIEEQSFSTLKELQRHKEMLEVSWRCQVALKERVLQVENESKKKLLEGSEALERMNSQLNEKICEADQLEFESWQWKSIAERLKLDFERSQELRKELEASLLAQVGVGETTKQERKELVRNLKERDREIENLRRQMTSLEKEKNARNAETASSEKMESTKSEIEKDETLKSLREEVELLEQESVRKELEVALFEHTIAQQILEKEIESLSRLIEEKDRKIDELLQHANSAKENSTNSVSLQLAEKEAQLNLVHQAWERVALSDILGKQEIEEKNLMIIELVEDIQKIQTKLEMQEKSFSCFRQQASDSRAKLERKWNESKELTEKLQAMIRSYDVLVAELRDDIQRLSQEKENLMGLLREVDSRMCKVSDEDMKLIRALETVVGSFDDNRFSEEEAVIGEPVDSSKENMRVPHSPPHTMKKMESIPEERLPFRPVN